MPALLKDQELQPSARAAVRHHPPAPEPRRHAACASNTLPLASTLLHSPSAAAHDRQVGQLCTRVPGSPQAAGSLSPARGTCHRASALAGVPRAARRVSAVTAGASPIPAAPWARRRGGYTKSCYGCTAPPHLPLT